MEFAKFAHEQLELSHEEPHLSLEEVRDVLQRVFSDPELPLWLLEVLFRMYERAVLFAGLCALLCRCDHHGVGAVLSLNMGPPGGMPPSTDASAPPVSPHATSPDADSGFRSEKFVCHSSSSRAYPAGFSPGRRRNCRRRHCFGGRWRHLRSDRSGPGHAESALS